MKSLAFDLSFCWRPWSTAVPGVSQGLSVSDLGRCLSSAMAAICQVLMTDCAPRHGPLGLLKGSGTDLAWTMQLGETCESYEWKCKPIVLHSLKIWSCDFEGSIGWVPSLGAHLDVVVFIWTFR